MNNSIAAELLQQINLTKIRPTPNYLSAADALNVEEFEQSEYGNDYSLDVSNIEWGKACMYLTFLANSPPIEIVLKLDWTCLTLWQPIISITSGTDMCSSACTKSIWIHG